MNPKLCVHASPSGLDASPQDERQVQLETGRGDGADLRHERILSTGVEGKIRPNGHRESRLVRFGVARDIGVARRVYRNAIAQVIGATADVAAVRL